MGFVYKYLNKRDKKAVYVGIVYGDSMKDLDRRLAQHKRDPWFTRYGNYGYSIFFFEATTRTDLEAYEASLINELHTGRYGNTSKVGWGVSDHIKDELLPWIEYDPPSGAKRPAIENAPDFHVMTHCALCGKKLQRVELKNEDNNNTGMTFCEIHETVLITAEHVKYYDVTSRVAGASRLCLRCCDMISDIFEVVPEYCHPIPFELHDKRLSLLAQMQGIIDSYMDEAENQNNKEKNYERLRKSL